MSFTNKRISPIVPPTPQPKKFVCTRCGSCCLGYGGILIDAKAARAIAGHLGLTPAQVENFYLKYEGRGMYSVKNSPGNTGSCLFYSGEKCLIDPVKPPICKAWPFLYGILYCIDAFDEAKSICPGLKDMTHEEFLADFRSRGLAAPPRSYSSLLQLGDTF